MTMTRTRTRSSARGAVLVALLPLAALSQEAAERVDTVPQVALVRITALLAEMDCTMETSGIQAIPAGGYVLDGVECADGRFDLELDAELNVTARHED